MAKIATEQNSTIVLPVPLDLFGPFIEKSTRGGPPGAPPLSVK